jgi:hypothetical protein
MPTVERRLEKLEHCLPSRKLRDVRDVTELSNVELSLYLLDDFALLDARELVDFRNKIASTEWLCDDSLTDPLECYAACLLRTVIWGHDNEALDGPTREAAPMLAEEFRGRFPDRVFAVAEKAPPWPHIHHKGL